MMVEGSVQFLLELRYLLTIFCHMMTGGSVQFLLEIVPPYYNLITMTGGYAQILTRNHNLCFSASVFIIHSRWLCAKCANFHKKCANF